MTIGEDHDGPGPYASPPCLLHELDPDYLGGPAGSGQRRACTRTKAGSERPIARLLPDRPFPPYAYLPGRFPHPVRDPRGHSYKADKALSPADADDPGALLWGADLFNHGFYWEAHEAWEELWRCSPKGEPERDLLHGLILLAASGVKVREGKWDAARRHGRRAASYLRQSDHASVGNLMPLLGWSPSSLAVRVEEAMRSPTCSADEAIAFDIVLGCAARPEP